MKKVLTAISMVLLVVVLAMTMTGCDKSGKIKKAFEKEGYEVTVVNSKDSTVLSELLTEDQKEDIDKYEVIVCKKLLSSATIIKFPSANDLKEVLGEDAYNKAVEAGLVNGNCYLALPLGNVVDIFKNA